MVSFETNEFLHKLVIRFYRSFKVQSLISQNEMFLNLSYGLLKLNYKLSENF